jgi:hypothetical protein
MGRDGLIYQREDLGPVAADQTFTIEVDYTKDTPLLTASTFQSELPPPAAQVSGSPVPVPPGAGATQAGPSPSGGVSAWLIPGLIVAGVGILLVFMALKGKKAS